MRAGREGCGGGAAGDKIFFLKNEGMTCKERGEGDGERKPFMAPSVTSGFMLAARFEEGQKTGGEGRQQKDLRGKQHLSSRGEAMRGRWRWGRGAKRFAPAAQFPLNKEPRPRKCCGRVLVPSPRRVKRKG